MLTPKQAAKALTARLKQRDIAIKRVQAHNLIAAACGFANRDILATHRTLPRLKRINIALLTSATTILARHDAQRRQILVNETAATLAPIIDEASPTGPASAERNEATSREEPFHLPKADLLISCSELEDPERFLATERGKALITRLTCNTFFEAWEPSNRPIAQSTINSIARDILPILRNASSFAQRNAEIFDVFAEHFTPDEPEDRWYDSDLTIDVEDLLHALESDIDELELACAFDEGAWEEALREAVIADLWNSDQSSPFDMISSHDHADIMFYMVPNSSDMDDFCTNESRFLEPDKMHVDAGFTFALARLGYSIDQYREMTHPDRPDDQPLSFDASQALITPSEFSEIVENACTQFMHFVVYARIPLLQLIKLDLSEQIAFSRGAVATYNGFSGTFQDVRINREIAFQDGVDGRLEVAVEGRTPDDICGLVTSYYTAHLYNPARRRREHLATIELDAHLASNGLIADYPLKRLVWKIDEDPLRLQTTLWVSSPNSSRQQIPIIAVFGSSDSTQPQISQPPHTH